MHTIEDAVRPDYLDEWPKFCDFGEDDGMGINPEWKECIGFLCDDTKGKRQPIGTAFFVHSFDETKTFRGAYVVTARHNIDGTGGRKLHVRLNKAKEKGVDYLPVPSFPSRQNKWHLHPDSSVDLAVARVENDLNLERFKCTFIYVDDISVTPENLRIWNTEWPVAEYEDVMYMGMMNEFGINYKQNLTVVRSGRIALVTSEKIEGEYGPSDYYLIESQTYQGHSGSPVFWTWEGIGRNIKAYFLGILVASHPTKQEVLTRTRIRKGSGSEKDEYGYFSLGISLVVPAQKLLDIMNSQELKDMREKDKPSPQKPVPIKMPKNKAEQADLTKQDFEKALKKASRKRKPSESDQESPK